MTNGYNNIVYGKSTPQEHVLWEKFVEFCPLEYISLEHQGDWQPWWNAFVAGAKAAVWYVEKQENQPEPVEKKKRSVKRKGA